MLLQILREWPDSRYLGRFIASRGPSYHLSEIKHERILGRIKNILSGELMPCHLFYHSDYANVLAEKKAKMVFIYRDPRDCLVSEVDYILTLNPLHRLHKHFKNDLKSNKDRVKALILGDKVDSFPADYPGVAERFERYRGWLDNDLTFVIKYEELIDQTSRMNVLERLAMFLGKFNNPLELARHFEKRMNPQKSHTFNVGRRDRWREYFDEECIDLFKEHTGKLLVNLGYETNDYW